MERAHNTHQLLAQRLYQEMCDEDGNGDRAGEQLLAISSTGVTIGEDLFEGQSWTMGVVLLVTVGVGLLRCVCAVFDPHLPTGNVHVTREPEVAMQPSRMTLRSMRAKIINHVRENVESLTVFWISAVAADGDVTYTALSRYTGTVLAAHCHHE